MTVLKKEKGFLAIGNYDSNVGYAWRLMESFWCAIAAQIRPMGYINHIAFPSVSTIPECLEREKFSVHLADFTKKDPLSVMRQCYLLWKNNIKFLYLTDFRTFSFLYLLYRMMGVKKIITHDHTPGVRTPPSAIKLFVKRLLHKATWASADACFAVSPFVARRLVDVNGVDAKRVFCITNGIRVDSLPVEKNIHTGIRIVTVARANYYKGIDFAIKVIASLVVRAPEIDFTYTLYGDGPHIDEFKLLATNLNVSDRIIFAGRVSDVSDKLLSADIAFHPSLGEAMSLALLEYMRAQLPLVVSSNPSVSSFLTKNVNALIYDERDISSATEVLLTLINSAELRTNLGRNAWLSVKEEFNETQMFGALEKSIAQIIN